MTRWQPPARCGACPDGTRVRRWQPLPGDNYRAEPCGHTLTDIHAALTEVLATRLLPNPWSPQPGSGPVSSNTGPASLNITRNPHE